jgi:hypothetical protein
VPLQGRTFNVDELLRDELVLSKLDIGRRQLNTAVRMFFFDEDVVSLHTVTSAAHCVLRDMALDCGIAVSVKDSPLISDAERSKYLRAFNFPQNYFKHADKDATAKIVFCYNVTFLLVLDAIVIFNALDQPLTREMKIFLMWVQLRFPDLLRFEAADKDLSHIRETTHNSAEFKVLARMLLREHDQPVA